MLHSLNICNFPFLAAFISKYPIFNNRIIFFCLVHNEEMLKESQVSKEHLRAELEEAKISLQKAEVPLAYSFTVEAD